MLVPSPEEIVIVRWIALVFCVLVFSGCQAPRFDRVVVKATPKGQDKFDFSVEFFVSPKEKQNEFVR